MSGIVLDTSVIIKWFDSLEEDSDKADLLLSAIQSGEMELVLPHFAQLEIANILRLGKNFLEEKTKTFLTDFSNLEPKCAAFNPRQLLEISKMGYRENITSYDCSFVVASNFHDIPLFTADYGHHKKELSDRIVWLKEWNGKV